MNDNFVGFEHVDLDARLAYMPNGIVFPVTEMYDAWGDPTESVRRVPDGREVHHCLIVGSHRVDQDHGRDHEDRLPRRSDGPVPGRHPQVEGGVGAEHARAAARHLDPGLPALVPGRRSRGVR
jgi:hypothetical protein